MTRTGRIAILTAGTCIVLATAVRAEADESMQSRGTIRFQGTEGIVQTWTEDTPEEPVKYHAKSQEATHIIEENRSQRPVMTEDFLTENPYSRPGEKLENVNNIFVHYTANKGTSAAQNRSYFENLGITGETSASAHFIIGYEGEIIQCIPLDEIAYAVAGRNYDSISIECCYQDADVITSEKL